MIPKKNNSSTISITIVKQISQFFKSKYQIFVYVPLVIYLLINTGLFSDEFMLLSQIRSKSLLSALKLDRVFFTNPLSHYFFNFFLFFLKDERFIMIVILKMLYILLMVYLLSKFFTIFFDQHKSILAAFLFIFYPIHDSITYFFLAEQMFFNFAFYCYAYYLAYNKRFILACIFSFLGSFIYYGSPPIALGLFVLFLLDKQIKKGLIIYIPNLIYVTYYLIVIKMFNISELGKLPKVFNIATFIKYFVLQIFSFIDAMLGPSMWIKVYYSFHELSIISWIIGGLLSVCLFLSARKTPFFNESELPKRFASANNHKLLISLVVMLSASFIIFAITGRYPQMAFNFGNRVTIYGAFIAAYLIVAVTLSIKKKAIIYSLLIFVILGISDHWKSWTLHQQNVIEGIKYNESLKNYNGKDVIYVSGNQYSRYGPISHIEFLSEDWVPTAIFSLALNRNISARSLNKRHRYEDGYLIDTKYDLKSKVNGYIYVYDSQNNRLFHLESDKINSYIGSLPYDNRHWIQIINIKFIKDKVKILMPSLKYAL